MPQSVLVMGASGYVGSHLVPFLIARGYHVRAASRRSDTLEARGWHRVELVETDALDPVSLEPALRGIETAYYLVHSMAAGRDFAALDREAADHFRLAAQRAGVRRIIYLGGLQPSEASSAHLRSRRETGDRLRAGPVPVTELRVGIIVGAGSAAFEVIRDLVYHLPVMVTPRWVRSRSQPIALDDLLEILVRLPNHEEKTDRIYDAVGPETLTYEELLRQFAEAVGRRLWILPVRVLSPRLSSWWLDLVTSVPASVARPLIDGLKHDLVSTHPTELCELLPRRLRTYAQAARTAVEAETTAAIPARWTEGAFRFRQERHDISYYSKSVGYRAASTAPPETAWAQVIAIGGDRGWVLREPTVAATRPARPSGGRRRDAPRATSSE